MPWKHKPRAAVCAICGREFVPHDSRSRCCSPECSRLFTREYNREYRRNRKTGIGAERRTLREKILGYAEPVSENALFTAHKKPRGTSDVRWRIELSRRRLARIYGRDGGGLPDPDVLA